MATTRLIIRHVGKGETIAQSLADGINYGKNPDKTQDGELISAYMCDPETADAEFLLSKAQYKSITGREQKKEDDILYYQVRQSFAPGEITSEAANQIGYAFAMRWTKGKYAFFVATHIDRHHIHNHIYYNSTALDCTRKFRNFIGSSRAIRRLSDRICIENGLSYIKNPKLRSKGKFRHYGEWLGNNKPQTWQEKLKAQIDRCLAGKPPDMDAFLQSMATAGYETKHGRGGAISFRASGQERFTRLRSSTLGKGYGPEDIQAIIESRSALPEGVAGSPPKVNLIIDIQSRMRAGKGPAYERWAKVFNLKMMAQTLQYLQENNLLEYVLLERKATDATDRFHAFSEKIRTVETAIGANKELMTATVDYARTRAVFDGYKAAKYSRKYYAEHEADFEVYRAAQATFKRVLNGAKLPKMDTLKKEFQKLVAEKRLAYKEYKAARAEMQEVITVKTNIDRLLGLTDSEKNKEMER